MTNYGQQWQYPPNYPPPPPPKRKSWARRHWVLTTLAVLTGMGVIGSLIPSGSGGGDATGTGYSAPDATAADEPAAPAVAPETAAVDVTARIGTPARDGQFEFTVTKIRCGVHTVGPADLGETAQGQFCLATVKVGNIGDEARTLDASDQYGYDTAGRRLDADGAAGLYANPSGGGAFLNDINPGNAVTAVLVFDVAKTARLARLELHDSPFSGGVVVDVVT